MDRKFDELYGLVRDSVMEVKEAITGKTTYRNLKKGDCILDNGILLRVNGLFPTRGEDMKLLVDNYLGDRWVILLSPQELDQEVDLQAPPREGR